MMRVECCGKRDAYRSRQCLPAILTKNRGCHPEPPAKGARKGFVMLKSSFQSDLQHGRTRRQQQPCATVQSEPSLVYARSLAEHLHHQAMKLSARKTSGTRHRIHGTRDLRRTESPAQTADSI